MKYLLLIISLASSFAFAMERTPSPKGAEVYFITPANGATVKNPVTLKFGLKGMGIAPVGVNSPNTGHHHLLINNKIKNPNLVMPASKNLVHFGGGQTETTMTLPKGKHKLQLVLGDHNHIPHKPIVQSKVIEITVK